MPESDPFALLSQPVVELEERYNAWMFPALLKLARLAEAWEALTSRSLPEVR